MEGCGGCGGGGGEIIKKGTILPPISSKNSLKIVRIPTLGKNPNTERKKNSTLPSNRYKWCAQSNSGGHITLNIKFIRQ